MYKRCAPSGTGELNGTYMVCPSLVYSWRRFWKVVRYLALSAGLHPLARATSLKLSYYFTVILDMSVAIACTVPFALMRAWLQGLSAIPTCTIVAKEVGVATSPRTDSQSIRTL